MRYQIVGSFKHMNLQILMPKGMVPGEVRLNDKPVNYEIVHKGKDAYVTFSYDRECSTALEIVDIYC